LDRCEYTCDSGNHDDVAHHIIEFGWASPARN